MAFIFTTGRIKMRFQMQRTTIITVLGISLFLFVLSTGTGEAIPTLQLYIPDSTYDAETESWMIYANSFELQVLGASSPAWAWIIRDLYLHIAVPEEYWGTGSVTIQGDGPGKTITQGNFVYGRPQKPQELKPPHDIYPTYYYSLRLEDMNVGTGTDIVYNYNPGESGQDTGVIQIYNISYDGFFMIHMDASGIVESEDGKQSKFVFAPFSHDADSVIPEPSTLLLLGVGIGMIWLWRRIRRA